MLYLIIKEFKKESSIYVLTSSLIKDITCKVDLFRMNALRTIPVVLDSSTMAQVERYIKMGVNEKIAGISSGSLLCALQISNTNLDLIKKWSNEV